MGKVKLSLFKTGYCVHPEKIAVKDGSLRKVKFPALVGLISHPEKGYILFDTGYASHFFEACEKFPYSIYPKVTPVFFNSNESIKEQLLAIQIHPDEIDTILISHFHGDHVGGLKDFPNSKIICSRKGYEFVKDKKRFQAVRNGYLPDLIPTDFEERAIFIDDQQMVKLNEEFAPFQEGWDLFGDGSLICIDLTGHATGQLGLFLHDEKRGDVLLCADACWQSRAYREKIYPHRLANIIMSDIKSYQDNLDKLNRLHHQNPEIRIIPTHCTEIWEEEL